MSFDVFFQGFIDGDESSGGGDRMREVLAPHIMREEPEHHFVLISYGDATADIYLSDDHMMANHVAGAELWDLLVQGARAAGWVIIAGPRVCIIAEAQRAHLPEGLGEDAVLIASGAGLLDAIRSA